MGPVLGWAATVLTSATSSRQCKETLPSHFVVMLFLAFMKKLILDIDRTQDKPTQLLWTATRRTRLKGEGLIYPAAGKEGETTKMR